MTDRRPADDDSPEQGLYLALFSIHGLIRTDELELGRDADTGGQVTYVLELARALAARDDVEQVDLITRRVFDRRLADDYAEPFEEIAPGARLVRLRCGPRRYLRKETLWPYLDELERHALGHFRRVGRRPDVIHAHYADAGEVGRQIAATLGLPLVVTGHSLGRVKRRRLLDKGMAVERIESRYNIERRIAAEEEALAAAALVVTSTRQEIEQQWSLYDHHDPDKMVVIPPGVELERFRPAEPGWGPPPIADTLERFLRRPDKPMILAITRPDPRKNIEALVEAYAGSPELRRSANLVLVMGTREDLAQMDKGPRSVLKQMLYLVDLHDLYGLVAYPKQHSADDVPDLYRLAAESGGVFVNPALTEPFGLTLIEAAASGLPVVATEEGGPREILRHCANGELIDPLDVGELRRALLSVLGDRGRWRELAASGVEGARRHYSWQGHAETYVGRVTTLAEQVRRRPKRLEPMLTADRLLITDLDDTLFGDGEAVSRFVERLTENRRRVAFGVATGRRLESALEALEEWGVPLPDLLVTSVGARIHYGGGSPVEDQAWTHHIDHRWQRDELLEVVAELPGVELQDAAEQLPQKLSLDVDAEKLPPRSEVRRLLRQAGLRANLIYSHAKHLDFLPMRASKGHAIDHLLDTWGFEPHRVLVAGNSGNDAEMIEGDRLGVVVGNYSPELERLRGKPRVYFAHAEHADGILEGAEHFDFFGELRKPADAG